MRDIFGSLNGGAWSIAPVDFTPASSGSHRRSGERRIKGLSAVKTQRSITQLDFERRWQEARLIQGELLELEAQSVMICLEELELMIAATPAESVEDLAIKMERLAAALLPNFEASPQDSLEDILLTAVLDDCRRLAMQGTSQSA